VIRHQLRFAQADRGHRLEDLVEGREAAEAVGDGADLDAAEGGVDARGRE